MGEHFTIDASTMPELRREVEEARTLGKPIHVGLDTEDIAVLTPISVSEPWIQSKPTPEQIDSATSAAGSWEGLVDVDELKVNWRAARGSSRPTIAL